jgi:hypothetical protein
MRCHQKKFKKRLLPLKNSGYRKLVTIQLDIIVKSLCAIAFVYKKLEKSGEDFYSEIFNLSQLFLRGF